MQGKEADRRSGAIEPAGGLTAREPAKFPGGFTHGKTQSYAPQVFAEPLPCSGRVAPQGGPAKGKRMNNGRKFNE